jgi:hypothetical protein
MVGPVANRVLDKLHQATVGVLVLSTLYFGVEAFRATWYIQKHKAEQRVSKSASAFITSLACDFVIVKRTSCMVDETCQSCAAVVICQQHFVTALTHLTVKKGTLCCPVPQASMCLQAHPVVVLLLPFCPQVLYEQQQQQQNASNPSQQ